MKKNKHPPYQKVLFVDSASGHRFICSSTLQPQAKETHEGVEYPVSYLSISSSSHPFYIGSKQFVDSGGRVSLFQKRFKKKKDDSTESGEAQVATQVAETPQTSSPTKPAAPQKKEAKATGSTKAAPKATATKKR